MSDQVTPFDLCINTPEFLRAVEAVVLEHFGFLEKEFGCKARFIRRGVFWQWTGAYRNKAISLRIMYDPEDVDVRGRICARTCGFAPVWLRGVDVESCIAAIGGHSAVEHFVGAFDRSLDTVTVTCRGLASAIRANATHLLAIAHRDWRRIRLRAIAISRERRVEAETAVRRRVEKFVREEWTPNDHIH